jgi:flavodoxin
MSMSRNILIVYYSQTGNTRIIADLIKGKTNGKLCEITPIEPYLSLQNGGEPRIRQERRDKTLPPIQPIESIQKYNPIFLGTPNWGNSLSHPIRTFLSNNDLDEKAIYPFCTHGGSGLGRIAQDIASICPKARVLDCFETYGNGGSDIKEKVESWIDRLKL